MTPQEKAKELLEKFKDHVMYDYKYDEMPFFDQQQECARIVVDEITTVIGTLNKPEYAAFVAKQLYTIPETEYDTHLHGYELLAYWEEVKQEINKLCPW